MFRVQEPLRPVFDQSAQDLMKKERLERQDAKGGVINFAKELFFRYTDTVKESFRVQWDAQHRRTAQPPLLTYADVC